MGWLRSLALSVVPAEFAHKSLMKLLKFGVLRVGGSVMEDPRLTNTVLGCRFQHPVGLAAGFDKNGECIKPLLGRVFSFVEVGTTTLKAQPGNKPPRVFRLIQDEAVINRLGFNNEGVDYLIQQIKKIEHRNGVIGVNIGMSKGAVHPVDDYLQLLYKVYPFADYVVINISSPNTQGLRDLQHGQHLEALLSALHEARKGLSGEKSVPIMLKIAPDLSLDDVGHISNLAMRYGIDGIILTNTTLGMREGLRDTAKSYQQGGLSGRPLFKLSTEILRQFHSMTHGRLVLIGCGGISDGNDAYEKIKAGASLLQLYTGIIYKGFSLVESINQKLLRNMQSDGFSHISEVIGSSHY